MRSPFMAQAVTQKIGRDVTSPGDECSKNTPAKGSRVRKRGYIPMFLKLAYPRSLRTPIQLTRLLQSL